MKQSLRWWALIGFLFTAGLGSLLHFIYAWSGEMPVVGAVTAVNESTWEHMKLLFVPAFLFSLVQAIAFCRTRPKSLGVNALAMLIGLLVIPVLFYTLMGMFGKTADWVNIGIFVAADTVFFGMNYGLLKRARLQGSGWQAAGLLCLLLLALLFVFFTYDPPRLPLFLDPLTGKYGIA